MSSTYSILNLEYMPVSVAGGVRKSVGGFLRYIHFRDQHAEPEHESGFDGFVRYVAHRDRTSRAACVFDANGPCVDADRRRLVDYVARSTAGLSPKWVTNIKGELEDRQRAVYQLIISPEDWRGLDLRRIARVAMRQLEIDAGREGIGPWLAAEHRNTAHHHVHVVLAARRELADGHFKTLLITRPRLERMKDAMLLEIARQRELERPATRSVDFGPALPEREPALIEVVQAPMNTTPVTKARSVIAGLPALRTDQRWRPCRNRRLVLGLGSLARHYRWQMERELEQEQRRREREGWLR